MKSSPWKTMTHGSAADDFRSENHLKFRRDAYFKSMNSDQFIKTVVSSLSIVILLNQQTLLVAGCSAAHKPSSMLADGTATKLNTQHVNNALPPNDGLVSVIF